MRTRRRGGIGSDLSGFPGPAAPAAVKPGGSDKSDPGPYVPKSNRATGSAYRLAKIIDAHTSLVVCDGIRSRGRIGASLSGFSGPTVRGTAVGGSEARPSHLRTYRRDPTARRIPGPGAASRLGWLRDRSERRSPFGKGCCPSHRRGGLVDGRKARACEKLHNHLLLYPDTNEGQGISRLFFRQALRHGAAADFALSAPPAAVKFPVEGKGEVGALTMPK